MATSEAQTQAMRRAFRLLNRMMLLLWRLGLGGTMAGPRRGYVMVLVTTGRKSGLRRPVPLNFEIGSGVVYCLAGFGRKTHWLVNLLADPACEVWLPDGRRLHGTGEIVTDEEERVELVRRLLVRAGFATRIAEPGLDPLTAPAEQIAKLGERYGVRYEAVRIELGSVATGPGGPGDLRWVLPVAAVLTAAACAAARLRRAQQHRR